MPTLELLDVDALRETVTTFRDVMRAHAADINRLNVYPVPDGDTGTNMARTLDAVVAEMAGAGAGLDATCDAIAHGSLMGARGNSGVILSQVLRGLVSTLRGQHDVTGATVAAALTASSAAAYSAVLKPIEGTILTVVRESAAGAERAAADGASLSEVLRAARDAGRVALAATPEQLPVLKDAGVVDAGGAGYLLLLDAALHVVDGEPLPEPIDDAGPGAVGAAFEAVARRASGVAGELDVSEQRYEVMFLCDLADEHIEAMKQAWGEIGDSIVVVGGDGLWNCHVHTQRHRGGDRGTARPRRAALPDPRHRPVRGGRRRARPARVGAASRRCPVTGRRRPTSSRRSPAPSSPSAAARASPPCSAQLGVQVTVSGGQTLNPSTADLLAAVERANADHVVVLPDNKNIIPVAEQVDALTAKTVRVVPTRSMPEGLAALIAYDPEADAPTNAREMRHASEAIDERRGDPGGPCGHHRRPAPWPTATGWASCVATASSPSPRRRWR